ncbi:hypothetical protein chiPu_0028009 [Chiloscyllium punctatum]|uniref:Uncharacterized protein n=1 Tax=Chiloscyllium punctatum TaxID=137246 RepID=A0A401TNB5_CHIPU|nr:hypothetical protein [Chiloscyllium punctatum]
MDTVRDGQHVRGVKAPVNSLTPKGPLHHETTIRGEQLGIHIPGPSDRNSSVRVAIGSHPGDRLGGGEVRGKVPASARFCHFTARRDAQAATVSSPPPPHLSPTPLSGVLWQGAGSRVRLHTQVPSLLGRVGVRVPTPFGV